MNNPCPIPEKILHPFSVAGPEAVFLTAALRSWLVNHLLAEEDLQELKYLLLELGFEPPSAGSEIRDYLKREMSCLAAGGQESMRRLVLLCEGLVQFYLLTHLEQMSELNQLNRFLPAGFHFSALSGRLLFEPERFFQADNLYYQEQSRLFLGADLSLFPDVQTFDQESPDAADLSEHSTMLPLHDSDLAAESALPDPTDQSQEQILPETTQNPEVMVEAKSESGPAPVLTVRGNQFRDIRKRRLQMLKEWGSETNGATR